MVRFHAVVNQKRENAARTLRAFPSLRVTQPAIAKAASEFSYSSSILQVLPVFRLGNKDAYQGCFDYNCVEREKTALVASSRSAIEMVINEFVTIIN
jgi:hypothetical protein